MMTIRVLSLLLSAFLLCGAQRVTGYSIAGKELPTQWTSNSDGDGVSSTQNHLSIPEKMNPHSTTGLGGDPQSRPCCVSWGHGRVDCFIRSPASHVLHKTITKTAKGREYSDWEDLGGRIRNEIECVSREAGSIDLLVLGSNSALFVNNYSEMGWTGWHPRGGSLMEVPSFAVRNATYINCMTRGSNNLAYEIQWSNGTWGAYRSMGSYFHDPIGCVSNRPEHVDCFAAARNNVLYHKYYTVGIGWKGWVILDGLIKGRPKATSWDENRIDVFALGMDNAVYHYAWDGSGWLPWESLGGVFEDPPECITMGVGRIFCFAVPSHEYLSMNTLNRGIWSGWSRINFRVHEPPSCVVSDVDEISCYARTIYTQIVELVFNVSSSGRV